MGISGCRRCGDCRGQTHLWCTEILTEDCERLQCKHCEATADLCEDCNGVGCRECQYVGVVNVSDLAPVAAG